MDEKALLELSNGLKIDLTVSSVKEGPGVLNVQDLYKKTGLFTYDPGFVSTASCSSSITFIDGDAGVLKYRGHNIADLAKNNNFTAVIYLLLYGELPNSEQHKKFILKIQELSKVSEQVTNVIKAFPKTAHPMSILIACFANLSASYHETHGNNVNGEDLDFGISAIAQVPAIVAMIYRHINNQEFINANNKLSYSENFLNMIFGSAVNNTLFVKTLDKIFTLHADHEQNASTAAVRLVGSAGSNIFASLSAGVATLWGPAHGGANEAVINMLKEIEQSGDVDRFIEKAKDDKDPFKLMGFGHRVYKNYDPRALILKDACHEILSKLEQNNELLEIAKKLEEIALKDEYFITRKLYPNVDFYSGIIMNAIGIPSSMFTPIFALARTTGWVAQWYEMVNDKETKICRPRQLYIGK
ncbi:citrate synthase [Wolbachia endosymbiont of Diaphorina citri]|jgi:citrate synthase I (hexameric type)|uniref:citrate synthase n=1 Tax=Wolbachia endosymbiont of Diaphorina citri TaxID=116598 RepID=UPI000315EECB|nr:citrate synthase [Wolbachia endosymbiont of Diaphorina citri]QJT94341.1 citrate synthase [Wolbachia endosymbiont of Diaphorina citri]QJT95581.1 citrate synthase [Wolbachia endosymbiont of Diaphorina citri]QJT96943.1 citrate synthase [Wolbachia endosymbiont of Diaphorina citri]QLK12068.1 citrate synthase [Wolbachia endosymbiont of Diaphorina citri]QXY87653.1 citrate synthase [Wolbachia endosymbiont of Diaphorina citri]